MADEKVRRRRRRIKKEVPLSRNQYWCTGCFFGLLAILPLMLGTTTTRPWPMLFARIAIVAIFVSGMIALKRERREVATNSLWLVLTIGAAAAMLQLLPLPSGLIAFISPVADRIYSGSLESLGLYGQGQWRSLSLDSPETWLGVSGFFSLLMVYLLGVNLLAHGASKMRFFQTLALTGFIVALIGYIHKVLGIDRVYGVFGFTAETPFFISTFINPNNLAGFLGMCVPIQIALAFKEEDKARRLAYLFIVVITASAIFLSLSRGGIIAFLAGQIMLAYLMWRRGHERRRIIWVQAAVLVVLLVSSLLALHEIAGEFHLLEDEEDVSQTTRSDMWKDASRMIGEFPAAGIGVEAFKVVYPIYKSTSMDRYFVYPENILFQTISETGLVLGGLVILFILLWFIRIFRRNHMTRLDMAACCSVFVILIHNYVDFNLNTFAIAVPFMAMLGILTARGSKTHGSVIFRTFRLPWRYALLFGLFASAAVLIGEAVWITQRLDKSRESLHATAYDRSVPQEHFETVLADALQKHPADYYLQLLASDRYPGGSYSAMVPKLMHLRRAQALNPSDPLIDSMIGRAYAMVGARQQAIAAYRQGVTKTREHVALEDMWAQMLGLGIAKEDLVQTVPDSVFRQRQLAEFLLKHNGVETAKRLLSDIADENNEHAIESMGLIARLEMIEGNLAKAKDVADNMMKRFPKNFKSYFLMGDVAAANRNYEEALKWYGRAKTRTRIDVDLCFAKARALIALKRYDEAEEVVRNIHALAWSHPSRRAGAYLLSGNIAEGRGLHTVARREFATILTYEPDNGAVYWRIGRSYEKQADPDQALKYYIKARALGEDNPALQRSIARIEALKAEKGRMK